MSTVWSPATHCCRRWGWWQWGWAVGCSGRSRPAGKPGYTGEPRSSRTPLSAAAAHVALRSHTQKNIDVSVTARWEQILMFTKDIITDVRQTIAILAKDHLHHKLTLWNYTESTFCHWRVGSRCKVTRTFHLGSSKLR